MNQLNIFGNTSEFDKKAEQEVHHFTLFIDGASRNNPGPSAAGIYLLKDSEVVCEDGYYLGIKTNNQAEYLALLLGLLILKKYKKPHDTVRVVSDSQLLVKQINGEYRVKHELLIPLHHFGKKLVRQYDAHVMHVLRTDNVEADKMANKGLDRKNPVPQSFIDELKFHAISL